MTKTVTVTPIMDAKEFSIFGKPHGLLGEVGNRIFHLDPSPPSRYEFKCSTKYSSTLITKIVGNRLSGRRNVPRLPKLSNPSRNVENHQTILLFVTFRVVGARLQYKIMT